MNELNQLQKAKTGILTDQQGQMRKFLKKHGGKRPGSFVYHQGVG